MIDLYRINLNLLIALDILLEEKNVTRAAEKVSLSQAAMSNNLQQLRILFKDRLLVSEKNKLVLTSYAGEIQPKLHRVLEELGSIIKTGKSFDPATCKRTFKIGLTDYFASIIYPKLIPILERQTPNITINTIAITQMCSAEPFENGEYDIAIGRMAPAPSLVRKKSLMKENCVCIFNAEHPLAKKKKITLSEYMSFKQVAWRTDVPDNPNLISLAMAEIGAKSDAVLYLPYIDSLFRLLEKSNNYVSNVLKSAAQLGVGKYNIAIKSLPFESPEYEWCVAWHPRFDDDLAHQWLRNQIINIFS
ncbi:MAG: LysR family transcriptional regulator [Gammaproteobacteria bacterium]|nr:LysR family transcriptional regulator [Gammaproteobacteria bacterium]